MAGGHPRTLWSLASAGSPNGWATCASHRGDDCRSLLVRVSGFVDWHEFMAGAGLTSSLVASRSGWWMVVAVLSACGSTSTPDMDSTSGADAEQPPSPTGAATTEPAETGTPQPVTCIDDTGCAEGFCDRGLCVPTYEPRHYGWPCDPALWEGADPILASKLNPCGAYVCRDLRCRSCESDDDCGSFACIDGAMDANHNKPGFGCGVLQ